MLENLSIILQVIIALGLLNVWILRFNKETAYRGGVAKTLKEEFAEYDLPAWSCYFVGFLKITSALLLIAGIWIPQLVLPCAILITFLMLSAVTAHIMIRDSLFKAMPALLLLAISGAVVSLQMV
jgi:hypothetical protein